MGQSCAKPSSNTVEQPHVEVPTLLFSANAILNRWRCVEVAILKVFNFFLSLYGLNHDSSRKNSWNIVMIVRHLMSKALSICFQALKRWGKRYF